MNEAVVAVIGLLIVLPIAPAIALLLVYPGLRKKGNDTNVERQNEKNS